MAYIALDNDFPGIMALLYNRPDIGRAVTKLVQRALRGPSPLTAAERELIVTYVSRLNGCDFCRDGHGATATALLGDDGSTAACLVGGTLDTADLDPRMRSLLRLASRVQAGGRAVTIADIEAARSAGATDAEIHDSVLVASLFCFINRWVDGLGTVAPTNETFYRDSGRFLARGYPKPSRIGRFFVRRMLRKYELTEGRPRAGLAAL